MSRVVATLLRRIGHVAVFTAGLVSIVGSSLNDFSGIEPVLSDDFVLSVPATDIVASEAFLDVGIEHVGLSGPMTMQFDPKGTDIVGTFGTNPAAGTAKTAPLKLVLPARYGAGGTVDLAVTATQERVVMGVASYRTHTLAFTQHIAPLYTLGLDPFGTRLTSAQPVDVTVTLTFPQTGPYSGLGLGRVDLSAVGLPPGVTAQFLPDAVVNDSGQQQRTVTRTLRLVTDGSAAAVGSLLVRATASQLAADNAGERPYVETPLGLTVVAGPVWTYLNGGASYTASAAEPVGQLARRSGEQVLTWIEDTATGRKVYATVFDGALWSALPGSGAALEEATSIDEASAALAGNDDLRVAYVWNVAPSSQLAVATAGPSGWTKSLVNAGPARLNTPRLAASDTAGDVVAFIVAGTNGESALKLQTRSAPGLPFVPIAGVQPDQSINRDPDGRVVAGSTALALDFSGDIVVAWIEQPADTSLPKKAWVRRYSGAAWGAAIEVPAQAPLAPRPLQVISEFQRPTYVGWLEGSPARLRVAELDPRAGSWRTLPDTQTGDGALNLSTSAPANDFALTSNGSGLVTVVWSEGAPRSQLWAKTLIGGSLWLQLGGPVDPVPNVTRMPKIALGLAGSRAALYVAYARFLFQADDLSNTHPASDVFVVRWLF